MKKLLLLVLFFSSTAFAGYVTGDKIHFQDESTWVSSVYNKSLCLDGDTYNASIRKCASYSSGDNRRCLKYIKVAATQPVESTRQRCASYTGRAGNCQRWVTVSYVQDPVRTVKFFNGRDDLIKTETVVVPSCN